MTTSGVTYNLSGTIRNQGLPVAGISVLLFEYWRLANGILRTAVGKSKTGSRGEFNFDVGAGSYHLEVLPDANTRFLRQMLKDIQITANTALSINLKTGVLLSGRVIWENGSSVSNGRILAQGIEPENYRASEVLNKTQKYAIVLPKSKYCLAVRYELSEDAFTSDQKQFLSTSVAVIDLNGDTEYDIELPSMVLFKGKITDNSGNPIVGAQITLTPAINEENLVLVDMRMKATLVTDEIGDFSLLLESGNYDVVVQAPESMPLGEVKEKSLLIDHDLSKKFVLPEGYRLRGKVTFSGQSLKGCLIRAHGSDGKVALTSTSASGEFSVGVQAGDYAVSVSGIPDAVGRKANVTIAPWVKQVTVNGSMELNIELVSGLLVSGSVLDEDKKPRPGVKISVIADEGKPVTQEESARSLASSVTDEEGKYTIALIPGKYWVLLNGDEATAKQVEVVDEAIIADFTWTQGYILGFEVHGEDNEPIPRCRVIFDPYVPNNSSAETSGKAKKNTKAKTKKAATVTGFSVTDDNGVCQITLPAGVYTFRIVPPQQGSYQAKTIRQLSLGADMQRRVQLPSKKTEEVEAKEKKVSDGVVQLTFQMADE